MRPRDISPEAEDLAAQAVANFIRRSGPPFVYVSLRGCISQTFVQHFIQVSQSADCLEDLRVPSFDRLVAEDGSPPSFPPSLRRLRVPREISDFEFFEWCAALGLLDGFNKHIVIYRSDPRHDLYWAAYDEDQYIL